MSPRVADFRDPSEFRARVGEFLAESSPAGWETLLKHATTQQFVDLQRSWLSTLHEQGLAAPHWATEWGGSDLPLEHQVILLEELTRAGTPRLTLYVVGLQVVYNTLLAAGSDDQRKQHLPGILRGSVWCQGFSEPEAGSDLAALTTRARRDGDRYVISGHKVWSSFAKEADWCLLLARTSVEAPRHHGISLFLLDMSSAGIDVRPIRQSIDAYEFCEIFLDDVEVPISSLVGAENEGWQIAQTTLTAERGPGVLELSERMKAFCQRLLAEASRSRDPALRREAVVLWIEVEVQNEICRQLIDDLSRGGQAGAAASIIKLYFSETLQRLQHLGVTLSGPRSQLEARPIYGSNWESGDWLLDYIGSFGWTIAGGTNEIQRNLIAERALGLPRDRR